MRNPFLIIVLLALSSCTFNSNKIITLKTIDQFETQQENEQMAKELIRHPFGTYFEHELTGLSEEEINGISYQYHVVETNKEVHFRLVLNGKAKEKENRITKFFNKKVNHIIQLHLKYQSELKEATAKAREFCELIDRNEYEELWKHAHPIMSSNIELQDFTTQVKSRFDVSMNKEARMYYSQQVFQDPQLPGTPIFQIAFNFKGKSGHFERFSLIKQEDGWSFAGYNFTAPA